MQNGNGTNLASGVIAGAVGGLVASWVMNVFMENVGSKLQDAVETEEERAEAAWQQAMQADVPKEDATMKTCLLYTSPALLQNRQSPRRAQIGNEKSACGQ